MKNHQYSLSPGLIHHLLIIPSLLIFLLLLTLVVKLVLNCTAATLSWLGVLVVVFGVMVMLGRLFNIYWLKPQRLRWKLQRQGIKGPKPSLLYGNVPEMQNIIQSASASASAINYDQAGSAPAAGAPSSSSSFGSDHQFIAHDYTSTLFPYFEQWRKQYGQVYTYSTGNKQHLYVNDPELVKEMNQSITSGLGKPTYLTRKLAPLLGNGILRSNGHVWAQQRKIVAPEFFVDKVKGMVGLMIESTQPLVKKWEACIDAQGEMMAEIKVGEDLRSLSADVIARTCFGSSFFKGQGIFSKLRTLQETISRGSMLFGLPKFGFLATPHQKAIKRLEKEIEYLIWETVKERKEASSSGKDLLQKILEETMKDHTLGKNSSKKFIVDNCKNIYFAGHESTSAAASWCLMLLALYPEWQARIREEMSQACSNGVLDSDSLPKMKTVTIVIQEVMRLYPPAAFVSREALEDTQIGDIVVPKGVCIWSLIPTLHRDPEIWGPDANEFRPDRFINGVSNACKVPQAYVPFGLGPRLCLGRNLAMVQLKVVISLIISKFTFSLSPSYQHDPAYRMIVEPGNGVLILVQKYRQ